MELKEKILRILIEEDLYKVGESDTIKGKYYTFKITKGEYGWWDLEIICDIVESKISFDRVSKLARKILALEKLTW